MNIIQISVNVARKRQGRTQGLHERNYLKVSVEQSTQIDTVGFNLHKYFLMFRFIIKFKDLLDKTARGCSSQKNIKFK